MEDKYNKIFNMLNFNVCCVIFFKRNGELRFLFGTRDTDVIRMGKDVEDKIKMMNHYDTKCNISSGTISVFDIVLGEVRSFQIDRLIEIINFGEVKSIEKLGEVYKKYKSLKEGYESKLPKELMDMV